MVTDERFDALALRVDLHLERISIPQFERRRIAAAFKIADRASVGLFRDGGTIPFVEHILDTALLLKSRGAETDTVLAALLSEDRRQNWLAAYDFGPGVARIYEEQLSIVDAGEDWWWNCRNDGPRVVDLLRSKTSAHIFLGRWLTHLRFAANISQHPPRFDEIWIREVLIPSADKWGLYDLAEEIELLGHLIFDERFQSKRERFTELGRELPRTSMPDRRALRDLLLLFSRDFPARDLQLLRNAPEDGEILERLNRIDAALRDHKAPSVGELFGSLFGISLKGVWLWAEYLLRQSKRAQAVAQSLDADSKTGSTNTASLTLPSSADALLSRAISDGSDRVADSAARNLRELEQEANRDGDQR